MTVQRMRNNDPKPTTNHCTKPKGGMSFQSSLKSTSIPPDEPILNNERGCRSAVFYLWPASRWLPSGRSVSFICQLIFLKDWLKEIMVGSNIYVLLLISYFTKTFASMDTRNEEFMTTTTQPPNGLADDSMSDINLRPHDEEEILNNKPSLQNIIEWFCFAFIMSLLVIFILCSFVALFLKIRAYAKKKFNKWNTQRLHQKCRLLC